MTELPHTHCCFVCGESNPIGLNLRSETDGRVVRIRFTPRKEHIGFAHTVHGGLIATVLDEIMTWACAVPTKRFAYCAALNVRYVQPVPPQQLVEGTAELTANRRDRLFEAKAELRNSAGAVLATATGKYLPIKQADLSGLTSDFVGDPKWAEVFQRT
jgi:acyl-coenzyme A thioesterase PaaI-like protein